MFFKQVTFMRSTLIALSAMTFGMHNAAAMSSSETKTCAASTSAVSSSTALSSGNASSTMAIDATVPPPPVLTRTSATMSATDQQMQITPQADTETDSNISTLRQLLGVCMTGHKKTEPSTLSEKSPDTLELSAKELEILYALVHNSATLMLLGSSAITVAFNRARTYNWKLAKLIILSSALQFIKQTTTDNKGAWQCCRIIHIHGLTDADLATTFNGPSIYNALFEAIEKDQWLVLYELLANNYILEHIHTNTANELLAILALAYTQNAIIDRIVNSPILGPKVTAETYDLILKNGRPKDIATIRQSPYFEITMKKQQSTPRATSTITPVQTEPTEEEYQDALNDGSGEYEGFDEYLDYIKQHPTITIPKGVAC